MRVALLFPGQGAQTPGFLRRLPQHPAVHTTLEEARQVLGQNLEGLDSITALEFTAAVQLGTVIAGVAIARALAADGLVPDAVAGLSVGAFAAAVACETLSFSDALRLVKLRRLRVSIPSHCPLMDAVSRRLREAMQSIPLRRPRLPYVSNHRARIAGEGADVGEDLILNVSRTVRWHDSITLLYELGCRLFVESPPGEVLSNLVKSSFPEARAVALDDVPLATAVTLVQRAAFA